MHIKKALNCTISVNCVNTHICGYTPFAASSSNFSRYCHIPCRRLSATQSDHMR